MKKMSNLFKRRFGRHRRSGPPGIDAELWMKRIQESGLLPLKSLTPCPADGVPSYLAATGTGEFENGEKVVIGFAPRTGGDAWLAAMALATQIHVAGGFAGQVIAIAPQWYIPGRKRLTLLGNTPFQCRAIAAPTLAEGNADVEMPPADETTGLSVHLVAGQLFAPEARDLFQRAAFALVGIAAKYDGAVRGIGRAVELVVMARRVAALRGNDDGIALEFFLPHKSVERVSEGSLPSLLDKLESIVRKRTGDRNVRNGEEGFRARTMPAVLNLAQLRCVQRWPLGGAEQDAIDFAGVDARGRVVVAALRRRLNLKDLGAILDAVIALHPAFPHLFVSVEPPLAFDAPRLLLATEQCDAVVRRVLAALNLDVAYVELRNVESANVQASYAAQVALPVPPMPTGVFASAAATAVPVAASQTSATKPEVLRAESKDAELRSAAMSGLTPDSVVASDVRDAGEGEFVPAGGTAGVASNGESNGSGAESRRSRRGRRGQRGRNRRENVSREEGAATDVVAATVAGAAAIAALDAGASATGENFESLDFGELDEDLNHEAARPSRSSRRSRRGRRGRSRRDDRSADGERADASDGDFEESAEAQSRVHTRASVEAGIESGRFLTLSPDELDFSDSDTELEIEEDGTPALSEIEEDVTSEESAARTRVAPVESDASALSEDEEAAQERPRNVAIVAHADRNSVAAALLIARDARTVDGFWVYEQADLMTFFRGVATDLREDTPIFVVGFTASPARETIQTAALYSGRLHWFDHHEWPPEDLDAMRSAIGADRVHVEAGIDSTLPSVLHYCSRRSRFSDKLVDLIVARFSEHDYVNWGRLWWWRLGEIAKKTGDRRADIDSLLAGRPSDLAKEAERCDLPPLPTELDYAASRDFRLVHFGGYTLALVPVPTDQDLYLVARIVRERYGAAISLAWYEGSDVLVLAGDEQLGKPPLNFVALAEHITSKFAWVDALDMSDYVARFKAHEVWTRSERRESLIAEIAMGRTILEG